ncbi:hypothetical protein ACIRPX_33645 [Streptomyces sp. NPDC101225]|uniref:hypothetical protein n=1 Tax=Streptomyces sp. NPDC101225 TaxID=3366135 RepID=UPI0037FF3435
MKSYEVMSAFARSAIRSRQKAATAVKAYAPRGSPARVEAGSGVPRNAGPSRAGRG